MKKLKTLDDEYNKYLSYLRSLTRGEQIDLLTELYTSLPNHIKELAALPKVIIRTGTSNDVEHSIAMYAMDDEVGDEPIIEVYVDHDLYYGKHSLVCFVEDIADEEGITLEYKDFAFSTLSLFIRKHKIKKLNG
jgi:hypothetical protein